MTKGVKFRSIFYRFVLFIIVLFSLAFNQIFDQGFQTITFLVLIKHSQFIVFFY